jgi:hypothetical protein
MLHPIGNVLVMLHGLGARYHTLLDNFRRLLRVLMRLLVDNSLRLRLNSMMMLDRILLPHHSTLHGQVTSGHLSALWLTITAGWRNWCHLPYTSLQRIPLLLLGRLGVSVLDNTTLTWRVARIEVARHHPDRPLWPQVDSLGLVD